MCCCLSGCCQGLLTLGATCQCMGSFQVDLGCNLMCSPCRNLLAWLKDKGQCLLCYARCMQAHCCWGCTGWDMRRAARKQLSKLCSLGMLLACKGWLVGNLGVPHDPRMMQAYKVIPYGPIQTTMPYLVRRAQENSDIFKKSGVGKELGMIRAELARRLLAIFTPSSWQRPPRATPPQAAVVAA